MLGVRFSSSCYFWRAPSCSAPPHLPATKFSRFSVVLRKMSGISYGHSLLVLSLRVDWKGKAASHREASEKMSRAITVFRKYRGEDRTWAPQHSQELDATYWEAMRNSVAIPERLFVKLKARHLRKVELSKMLDSNPGCPVLLLRARLFWSSLKRVLGRNQ